jgi:hypothetical protein
MGKQTTGPSGYPSNFAALLDLIRFGFGIWGAQSMAVILFHAERSTVYGWQSDQHSRGQAASGIYSRTRRQWIRGPAGISPATWSRENTELTIDPTRPNQPSARPRVLRKIRRFTAKGGYAATEYALDWLALRAAIADWKERQITPLLQPLLNVPFEAPPLYPTDTRGCLPQTQALPPTDTRACLPQSHTVVSSSSSTVSESRAQDLPAAFHPEPVTTQTAPTHPLSNANHENQNPTPAAELLAAIEAAYGRPLQPNDPIPGQVLAIAMRLSLPLRSICRFIHDLAATWRDRRYVVTSPRLFLKATEEDLIPWIHANRLLIGKDQDDEERAAASGYPAQLATLPAADATQPELLQCPDCQQETLIDGTCHSNACVNKREQQRAALNRAAGSGTR